MTTDSDGITFEIDGVGVGASGLLEVSGRWYGVRGRRFVRPTLTLTLKGAGGDVRVLADLDLKPWAAEEGDPWRAAFPYDGELDEVASAELNVAPDITVELGPPAQPPTKASGKSRPAVRAAASSAAGARTPVIRDNPARPRPRAPRTAEVQRLHERLTTAEAATDKERSRREAADAALEQERGAARKLQAELGRLRAEHELAATVQSELDTASSSLDQLRGELRSLGAERDRIRAERDEAQRGLSGELAESERLRSQLADAEAAVRRLTQAGREARTAAAQDARATSSRPGPSARARQSPSAPATGQSAVADDDDGDASSARPPAPARSPAVGPAEGEATARMPFPLFADSGAVDRSSPDRTLPPIITRGDRPLNPSLRASSWVGRGIALVVLIVVIIALIVVVSSTGH